MWFMIIINVIIFGGMAALIAVIFIKLNQAAKEIAEKVNIAWQAVADKFSLELEPGKVSDIGTGKIDGKIDGLVVRVFCYSTGSTSHGGRGIYTLYRFNFPQPLGLGLHLVKDGIFEKIKKIAKGSEIVTQDQEFDKMVALFGNEEYHVNKFLTRERREKILVAIGKYSHLTIEDDFIQIDRSGVDKDPEAMIEVISDIVDLAKIIKTD